MISLPQVQFACDLCDKRVEVEIEFSYIDNPSEYYFVADDWMKEHGWRRLDEPNEIACPEHEVIK